jgi:hypothetical protein
MVIRMEKLLTAASGWCAIRCGDMKSAAVGWWLGLEWCCGGTVRLVMYCWTLWSGEEKVSECYQIDLNHEEQMEILLLIMI